MLSHDPRNTAVPRDPTPILDTHPTTGTGSPRRVALVAAVIAVVVVAYIAFLLARSEPEPVRYGSIHQLAAAIEAGTGGCGRVEPSRSSSPGQEIGVCRIGPASSTLTVYDDPAMVRPANAPPPSEGIVWVVGPNWIVATDGASAELVSDATNGRIAPT